MWRAVPGVQYIADFLSLASYLVIPPSLWGVDGNASIEFSRLVLHLFFSLVFFCPALRLLFFFFPQSC